MVRYPPPSPVTRPSHEERPQHHPRRRPRHPPLPADQAPHQAGRADRRQVPPHRHPDLQLHQQRPDPHLRPHAVPVVSLHRHVANTYQFDMFNRGFVEVLAAQQGRNRTRTKIGLPAERMAAGRLVPGHGRRRPPQPPPPGRGRLLRGADPLRRPALPHGLPPAHQAAPDHARPTAPSPSCRCRRTRWPASAWSAWTIPAG